MKCLELHHDCIRTETGKNAVPAPGRDVDGVQFYNDFQFDYDNIAHVRYTESNLDRQETIATEQQDLSVCYRRPTPENAK